MSKPYILEAIDSDFLVFVEVIHPIRTGAITHSPGAILEVSPTASAELIAAGVARRAIATGSTSVPIEEQLPSGIDPLVWRADPRLRINGQKPSSFVKIADFEESHPRNR